MKTMTNSHSRAAAIARRRGQRENARPGEEPIAALTPDLGPLPPIPVTVGAVLATDPTLVIARLVARAWERYRTDGRRTPGRAASRLTGRRSPAVADTRQPRPFTYRSDQDG